MSQHSNPEDPEPDLFDLFNLPAPSHRDAGEAELSAGESIASSLPRLRADAWSYLQEMGKQGGFSKGFVIWYAKRYGVTPDRLGTLRVTLAPRLSELRDLGLATYNSKVRQEKCGTYFLAEGKQS